ncbi:hypothetical protein [Bradyrhizobium japonicum]|uniref:hypothetical protein n=1 Tax=Bradyrhizobium japonicum TaxID=375 RepID=UPI00187324DA|nr:hypothetical protein [Bradyrhizobium japonicum]
MSMVFPENRCGTFPDHALHPLRHLLGLFLGEQQQHLDAHLAFLGRTDELYLAGALPQRGDDGDSLIGVAASVARIAFWSLA